VNLLLYAQRRLDPANSGAFTSALSVAGQDGTLRDRLQNTPAAGHVLGKTGSMSNISALSGYVEVIGGGRAAFSILMNGFPPESISAARSAQDAVALAVYNSGSQ
jgi:D-alanyl-D-alanine carboxypeptidase/D-alanyl-D-alanine-endopeptidase (penicillin-binding protein 4)